LGAPGCGGARLKPESLAVRVAGKTIAEAAALTSLDQYFDRADVVVKDPASLLREVEDIASRTPNVHERLAVVAHYMENKAKQPVPAMERFPLDEDDEGIRAVEALLAPHKVLAMHHWQGHTDYTRHFLRMWLNSRISAERLLGRKGLRFYSASERLCRFAHQSCWFPRHTQ